MDLYKKARKQARQNSTRDMVKEVKKRDEYMNQLLFPCVDTIDYIFIPELKRRGYDQEGRKLPYPYKPGEDPDSICTRLRRWWYYAKQSYYDN